MSSQTVSAAVVGQVRTIIRGLPSPFNTKDVQIHLDISRETLRRAMIALVEEGSIQRDEKPLIWLKTLKMNGECLIEEEDDEPAEDPKNETTKTFEPTKHTPRVVDADMAANFGDPMGDKPKRRPRPPGEARSRPGKRLAKSVEEAVCLAFELNETNKLPSQTKPNVLVGHLNDQELAGWLCAEFPENKRNYNSWLGCIRGQRSAYNRGALPHQRKSKLKPAMEIHEWIKGEAQRNIRRPRQMKLDLKAVGNDD